MTTLLERQRALVDATTQYLKTRTSPKQSADDLRRRLDARESSFGDLLRHAVFGPYGNPYRQLFDHAGVSCDDVIDSVNRCGLHATLDQLRDAGVWLTQEQFKGRQPIERGALHIDVSAGDFDNPLLGAGFAVETTGSRNLATRVHTPLELLGHESAYAAQYMRAFSLTDRPLACWRGVPPVSSGINLLLRYARIGKHVSRWFAQNEVPRTADTLEHHATTLAVLRAGRRADWPMPVPQYVHQDDAVRIARWLAEIKRDGEPAHLDTNASSGIRICIAALDAGLDIAGTFFRFGGEPFTDAKAKVVHKAGCRAACHYSMAEISHIAIACGAGRSHDDVHVAMDKLAVTTHAKTIHPDAPPINALSITTLSPCCPKIMINVECGDHAQFETRACGCPLGELGFDQHLSHIRSYDKATSEGMNFLGIDLTRIVEEVLPSRFGGHPTDYQFVEREQRGMPIIDLLVSPSVGQVDEPAVVEAVYRCLADWAGGRLMSDFWSQAKTVRVVRSRPYATGSSKILPLHTLTGA